MASKLYSLIRAGDLSGIRTLLDLSPKDVNDFNLQGHTPLMCAVENTKASTELVQLLIEKGANVLEYSRNYLERGRSVISLAIRGGDPNKVALLSKNGASLFYTYSAGYDALLDAAFAKEKKQLIDLIKLLVAHKVPLNTVSTEDEAALSCLSCIGQFDAVRILLEAGADPSRLRWTALHYAITLGSLEEVQKLIDAGADIEERDRRNRTPFLLAIQTGEVPKAEFLLERGANSRARGHCGVPALFFAIENHHPAMLDWLLRIGADIEQSDDFGCTPLMRSAEYDDSTAVGTLLTAGAKVDPTSHNQTPLARARNREIITKLLDFGADPRQLSHEGQRILLGLGEICDEPLLNISEDEFVTGRSPRYGQTNPERMIVPFWEAMIRSGVSGYVGAQICNQVDKAQPVWCADRLGQSLSLLPDGRIIQIGGAHEDSYDYTIIHNDVFVHHPDGEIHIFGYPKEVFPPTDFHSATLIGNYIYVLTSPRYQGVCQFDRTPVYRLDTDSLRFEQLQTTGESPSCIFNYLTSHGSAHEIRVSGGIIEESYLPNDQVFILDTQNLIWRHL